MRTKFFACSSVSRSFLTLPLLLATSLLAACPGEAGNGGSDDASASLADQRAAADYDPASLSDDGIRAVADLTAATSSDLTMASSTKDLTAPGDPPDLSDPPDLAMLPDLSDLPDLTILRDFTVLPDLTVVDLIPPPDLVVVPGPPVDVLQHHKNPTRDGLYTDPAFTKAASALLHRDATFKTAVQGNTYAQPLYFSAGPNGKELVIDVTESNNVYALDAANGAVVWQKNMGAPVPRASLPCGDIDPLGITGTPIIDVPSRTLFLDAMTTPDNGATKKHLLYALSLDDGTTRAGWPIDVNAAANFNGGFTSTVQNQRGALALINGTLYVPYGGHAGDCGTYHGWVVGVPINNPAAVKSWATRGRAGGVWAVSGIASDGNSAFVATGNTFGANAWADGEAHIRLGAGPVFSQLPSDYFAPTNWLQLDNGDVDIGGTGPVLFTVPGATPAKLDVALGKNGWAYVLDPANFGGINNGLASLRVASNAIINAAAAYTTAKASYVVFRGAGVGCPGGAAGDLTAIKIGAANPPTIQVAWCARQNGAGSPFVTTTDGSGNAVVWSVGAEGDQRLHGFDGDTGAAIFNGGGPMELMAGTRRFQTAIAVKGRIFVATDNNVYAFTVK